MTVDLRPATAADLEEIHQVNRRVEQHDEVPLVTPLEEFVDWLDDPHLDLANDTRVAVVDGAIVGFARVWHRPSGEREERAFVVGGVDPEFRRRGVGTTLMEWLLARAGELLRAAPNDLPRYIRSAAFDFEESAIRLYQRFGMKPVRYHDELLRDLIDLPDLVVPAGVDIIGWDPDRSEEARVAQNAAFADHWGSTPRDREAWEHDLSGFGVRLDLSYLAIADGSVIGVCRNSHYPGDQAVTGRLDGWIDQLSVVRSHRQRGVASALITASLRSFQEAGFTHAALGVDSENPTGAYRVYERLGFRPKHRSVMHQLEL
jgi:mycothiol synthase